jgi:Family of unknown function (DUF6788)
MPSRTGFTAKERALSAKLRQLLATPGLIRGSLVEMRRPCGKATCGCAADARRRHRSLYARQLKPAARRHLTRTALAVRLREDLTRLAGAGIWPAVQRSD